MNVNILYLLEKSISVKTAKKGLFKILGFLVDL